jgi:uncharacterized protein
MPKRDRSPVGAPCWVDLFTTDPDASRAFYGDLFGWTSEEAGAEYGGYITFSLDGALVAGCMRNAAESGMPDLWSVYLATEDAEATVDAAVAAGGSVVVPAMDVGELGRMAVLTDSGGAAIGAWQPGLHQGFGVVAEPGAPAWFELHTRAYDTSVSFYRDVFHWDAHTMSDTPEFRYTTLGEGDDATAGVMDATASLPDVIPPFWTIYFAVDAADATLKQVVALGGAVVAGAEDSPYGRLATAADPTGAQFRIVSN